jgi:hypothetical protein
MKNTILYPLRKEYPELNLKIEIYREYNIILFSGRKTPKEFISGRAYYFLKHMTMRNEAIEIATASHPAVYITDNSIRFYIGGIEKNDDFFGVSVTYTKYPKWINILMKYFKTPELNTNIRIL